MLLNGAAVDPPGEEWDALLDRLTTDSANRLRDFQTIFGTQSRSGDFAKRDVDEEILDITAFNEVLTSYQILEDEDDHVDYSDLWRDPEDEAISFKDYY